MENKYSPPRPMTAGTDKAPEAEDTPRLLSQGFEIVIAASGTPQLHSTTRRRRVVVLVCTKRPRIRILRGLQMCNELISRKEG